VKSDDLYGLLCGEAGNAWAWMALNLGGVEVGFPAYTDV
jgi:hypothetical protein